MGKKGASNIEFILAFMLFIGFVGAALYLFSPIKNTTIIESSLTYTKNEIIRNITVEIDSYSVKIGEFGENRIEIKGIDENKNAWVEDYEGKELPSRKEGNYIYFRIETGESEKKFVVIYFSEDFEEGDYTGSAGSIDFQLASSTSGKIISEERISRLKEAYESDYKSLKEQRDIPPGLDFSFSLEFPNGDKITAEKEIPSRAEVFSKTEIREVLRKDGTSEFAYLTVRAW